MPFIVIQRPICQEDVVNINIHVLKTGHQNAQSKANENERRNGHLTIIIGTFDTPLSIMVRKARQKIS